MINHLVEFLLIKSLISRQSIKNPIIGLNTIRLVTEVNSETTFKSFSTFYAMVYSRKYQTISVSQFIKLFGSSITYRQSIWVPFGAHIRNHQHYSDKGNSILMFSCLQTFVGIQIVHKHWVGNLVCSNISVKLSISFLRGSNKCMFSSSQTCSNKRNMTYRVCLFMPSQFNSAQCGLTNSG